ncbi:hypothetical protein Trydic_g6547 [Trypoxylus dichotomus]
MIHNKRISTSCVIQDCSKNAVFQTYGFNQSILTSARHLRLFTQIHNLPAIPIWMDFMRKPVAYKITKRVPENLHENKTLPITEMSLPTYDSKDKMKSGEY